MIEAFQPQISPDQPRLDKQKQKLPVGFETDWEFELLGLFKLSDFKLGASPLPHQTLRYRFPLSPPTEFVRISLLYAH